MMYDRQVATAKRLIAKYGAVVPVTTRVDVEDPDKPWLNTETEVAHNAAVVFLPLTSGAMKSLGMINTTEVPVGAVLAYMGAVDFEVDLKTTFLFEGKTWSMLNLDLLRPNGRIILHTMVLGS